MSRYAFKRSIPIMTGYIFIGLAFGILVNDKGYNVLWALAMSIFVYAGSSQFVLLALMVDAVSLPLAALMIFLVNSRHMFYGISFIDRFKSMGKRFFYMVYTLTDETYSVHVQIKDDKVLTEEEKNQAMFEVTFLNQMYWVIGTVLGALLGQFVPFDTNGIDFSMTALFIVIFVEHWVAWKQYNTHIPALTGIISSIICIFIFGPDRFILPSLIISIAFLLAMEKRISKKMLGVE